MKTALFAVAFMFLAIGEADAIVCAAGPYRAGCVARPYGYGYHRYGYGYHPYAYYPYRRYGYHRYYRY